MLELKNITKIYQSKKGYDVRALDDISIKFPEKGLVFVLGKSGSGKSTLLNIIGGLDKYNSGEIIIADKNTKSFSEADFDAYRNTYIGFVFQEYNILNEFSVAKNIALALELQGKKSTKIAVDEILALVDLKNLGYRKPNQLSGGQKQRVAIARALIKSPQIIVADEPTGSLDSNTGTQIFETLQTLSKDRLIIVVSHDRENAEVYADRIIEMADGKVVSDESKNLITGTTLSEGVVITNNNLIIKPGYQLTESDLGHIKNFFNMKNHDGVIISTDTKITNQINKVIKINTLGEQEVFKETKDDDIIVNKNQKFTPIASKFKITDAIKMGATFLKIKKARLIFTILLVAIALSFFGVSFTAGQFDISRTMIDSLRIKNTVQTGLVYTTVQDQGNWLLRNTVNFSDEKINNLRELFPTRTFVAIFASNIVTLPFGAPNSWPNTWNQNQGTTIISNELLTKFGFPYIGSIPVNQNEIMITDYHALQFIALGRVDDNWNNIPINNQNDLIGLQVGDYRISGIVNTKFNFDRYKVLNDAIGNFNLDIWVLLDELQNVLHASLHNVIFIYENFDTSLLHAIPNFNFWNIPNANLSFNNSDFYASTFNIFQDKLNSVILFDEHQVFLENQIIVDVGVLSNVDFSFESSTVNGVNLLKINGYGYKTNLNLTATASTLDELKQVLYSMLKQFILTGDIVLNQLVQAQTWRETNARFMNMEIIGVDFSFLSQSFSDIWANNFNQLSYNVWFMPSFIDNEPVFAGLSFGPYSHAVVFLNNNITDNYLIRFLTNYDQTGFQMMNEFSGMLLNFGNIVSSLAVVFLWVGLVFAIFSAFLMSGFISMTVNYKKREIGILRALGTKKMGVYSIFLSESMIMAFINAVLALIFTFAIVSLISSAIITGIGVGIVLMKVTFLTIVSLFLIACGIAALATLIPTYKISRLKPIDAINERK